MIAVIRHLIMALALSGVTGFALAQDTSETAEEVVLPDAPLLDVIDAADVSLDAYLWTNRLIVVFANSELDPNFTKQLELLRARPAELLDRDVIVITDTTPVPASDVRTALRPRAFGMVLIDKDGVIKLRKPSPWDVREIARSIDKTTLRQQEVRDARAAQQ